MRVGRVDDRFTYAPLVIKNHEVTEAAVDPTTLRGFTRAPRPERRRGARRSRPARHGHRSTRRLVARRGDEDPPGLRRRRSLDARRTDRPQPAPVVAGPREPHVLAQQPRTPTTHYYRERVDVLEALDEWFDLGGPFPTSPYWHRECVTCEFSEHCQAELEAIDDVSLTRFTSLDQQFALRDNGVRTRAELARLDPLRAASARVAATGRRTARRRGGSTRAQVRPPRRTDLSRARPRARQRAADPRPLADGLSDGRRRGGRRHGELRRRDVPLGRERHAEPTGRRRRRGLHHVRRVGRTDPRGRGAQLRRVLELAERPTRALRTRRVAASRPTASGPRPRTAP